VDVSLARIPHRVAVPTLLLLFTACCFISLTLDSATFDETSHVAAGVSYLETGDYRLNPEHPPLVKLIAALPLVLLHRTGGDYASLAWTGKPDSDAEPVRSHANQWVFGFDFLNGAGRDPAKRLTPARCAVVALAVLLALVVYAWSRALFGLGPALFALILAVTCPTLLAHARLVTTDLPSALGFTATAWLVWRWLEAPSWHRAACAGASLGAALLFKFSCMLLVPVVVALAAVAVATKRLALKRALAGIALVGAMAFAVLWGGYGFRYAASPDPGYVLEWQKLEEYAGKSTLVGFARAYRLVPEAYLYGIAYAKHQSAGRVSFPRRPAVAGRLVSIFSGGVPFQDALGLYCSRDLGSGSGSVAHGRPELRRMVRRAPAARFRCGRGAEPLQHRPSSRDAGLPLLVCGYRPRGRLATVSKLAHCCRCRSSLVVRRFVHHGDASISLVLQRRGGRTQGRHRALRGLQCRLGPRPQAPEALDGDPRRRGGRSGLLRHADPTAHASPLGRFALVLDFYPELPVVRPESGRYLAASVTLLTGVYLDADRASPGRSCSAASWKKPRSATTSPTVLAPSTRAGLPLIHMPDWMTDGGSSTPEQRRAAEDVIPATWLRGVRENLKPVVGQATRSRSTAFPEDERLPG
jgi:hypothetical protein